MSRPSRSNRSAPRSRPAAPAGAAESGAPLDGRLRGSVRAVVEALEHRVLLAGDFATVKALPFLLEWSGLNPGVADKAGQGTGLTFVQNNRLGNEYTPSLIDLQTNNSLLAITSSGNAAAGGNYEADNTLTNGIGTQFDAISTNFTITVRLKGPLTDIDASADQAGLMFGPDQDNYVKLVASAQPGGPVLQLIDEQKINGGLVHSVAPENSFTSIGSFGTISTLDLRLIGDPVTGKLTAFYRINNGGFVKLPTEIVVRGERKSAFFSRTGRAALLVMHKNSGAPLTAKFDRFEITAGTAVVNRPSVTATRPDKGTINVRRDAFVAVDVRIPNPGHGVDARTLSANTVKLYRSIDGAPVETRRNTSGGGDAIVVQPLDLLDANTKYTFELTEGVKDTTGAAFIPHKMTFTTGEASNPNNPAIAFEKINQPAAGDQAFTAVTLGPDGRLYAGTFDGKILRYSVNTTTGALGAAAPITTVINGNGANRTITGLRFDPASPADNLVLWVSHGQHVVDNTGVQAAEWTGKISRLGGANLEIYQDYVVGLPRSVRDHLNNQMDFGPDGGLYFTQAGNSSMGEPDNAWGLRPERLLSGAVLRLDTGAVAARLAAAGGPVDAKTEEGGSYDPFAAGAPLTIYATGIRNGYDLLWHSNGQLYLPANGSAAGGNTPGSPNAAPNRRIDTGAAYAGPAVPALINVPFTQDDFLFRIQQGGYYGHPNPLRGEYVLNGGNPGPGVDTAEVRSYPVGTAPDPNYRGPAHSFGKNYSPDGVIEYKGGAFGGALNGKLLVVRYSGGDDVVVLTPDASGGIDAGQVQTGVAGLTRFNDPLDLVEDTRNGFLYVAEYGGRKITLLRPVLPGGEIALDRTRIYVNDTPGGSTGPARRIIIRNTGTNPLALPADAFTITGAEASQFVITRKPALPSNIAPGRTAEVFVAMAANSTSPTIKTATLRIKSNDIANSAVDVPLRGLATNGSGGELEPSLQRILDLYQIPVNVGDPNPADPFLDVNAVQPNDEQIYPRFIKAGAGPVTIEPVAVFGVGSNPAVRFGAYEPGSPSTLGHLFDVDTPEAQSVSPTARGVTAFDPGGAAFGLYTIWPNFGERQVFGEDVLNSWEPTAQNRRKMRVYPMRNGDGSPEANAYIVAFEEFTSAYDYQDAVAIIRNVAPAHGGAEIGIENLDGAPFNDRLIFNRIQDPFPAGKPANVVHNTAILRLRNTGDAPLAVSGLSATGPFQIDNAPGLPASIAPGAALDVTVRFTATGGEIHDGTLTINSSDADEPTRTVQLSGWWQIASESFNEVSIEPDLAENLRVLGYSTQATFPGQQLDTGGLRSAIGEEVLSGYWARADATLPVTVRQLAAWHTQGSSAALRWHNKGSNSTPTLFTHNADEGQAFLPHKTGSATEPASGSFKPNGAFGFRIDAEWSDDNKNVQEVPDGQHGHHVRFYPARDRDGLPMPNTWIMVNDYDSINFDYQDNIYLVTNMRPEAAPAAPAPLRAVVLPSRPEGIALDWAFSTAADFAGYNVYRSLSAADGFTKLNGTPLTSSDFFDSTAAAGTTYYYRVTAVNAAGTESSPNGVRASR